MSDKDHTIICNSLECSYNNGKSGCFVIEIEIHNGNCESFSRVNESNVCEMNEDLW